MKTIPKPHKTSKATDLPVLFKKHKKLLSDYYHFTQFKEPILFFERRNGTVEFKEKSTVGRYEFKHSDGEDRYIIITGNPKTFKVGDKTFKGYYCHEDHPFPLPTTPLLTTEKLNMIIDKTLHDKKEWETKLTNARTKLIWTVALSICAIIGMIILFKILVPTPTPPTIQQQLAETVANNASVLIEPTGITVKG